MMRPVTDSSEPETAQREVRLTHVFDAPPEIVFKAWTDPEQVATWFAPEGLEIPPESVEIEPRVGGRFHLEMVESAGDARYPLRAEFLEISEPHLIVFQSEPMPEAGITEPTVTRVSFEADGERTRMTLVDGPYTDEMRGNAEAGWLSIVANLDDLLAG
jgi:uncharacterized protein YndB with AHSA1/START domain